MDIEKLIEQLNDWNEKYISNLCGDRTIKCEEYCIKDDCLIVKAATALSTLQAENEKLRADVVRFNDMLASYQNVLVPELLAELENYRSSHFSDGGCAAEKDRDLVIAENTKLRAELERVKVERDAYQVYFKDLSSKPDCNTCEKRNCDYRPKLGATVRVNCPLYSGPQKED